MQISDISDKYNFYTDHLKNIILKFWLEHATDEENGGFFTCFTPDGSKLVSKDKYIWSQGRITWLYSKLANSTAPIFNESDKEIFKKHAHNGSNFLQKYAISPEYECYFLLNEIGVPKESAIGGGLTPSSFADCFVLLGLNEYSKVFNDKKVFDIVLKLYSSLKRRIENKSFCTAPFLVPTGVKIHAIPMMMINITNEMYKTCVKFNNNDLAKQIINDGKKYCNEVLNEFVKENYILLEQIDEQQENEETILSRHVNPGHSLEDMWFVMESCEIRGDVDAIKKALKVIECTYELGQDKEYGGIFYYVDKDGGKPKGICRTKEDDLAQKQFERDWDCKLWWPHSEALYTMLKAYDFSKDESFLKHYLTLHSYVFKTFPNNINSFGEWIQLRDRKGQPIDNSVGGRLPVKDPYHTARNLILLIELLFNMQQRDS